MRSIGFLGLAARAGLAVLAWQGASEAKVELSVVASSATRVAGTDDGHISTFDYVYLAENGNLAWLTQLKGTGITGALAAWRDSGDGAELLLMDGDTLEGIDGQVTISTDVEYGGVPGPYIDEEGNVTLRLSTTSGAAIVTGSSDDWQVVAVQGAPAPGTTDMTFYELRSYYPAGPGAFLFEATAAEEDLRNRAEGIWLWKDGKAKLIALTGEPAPGYAGQFFDANVKPMVTAVNADGRFAFTAQRTGDASVAREALWTGTAADDIEVAVALDPPKAEGMVDFGLKSLGQYIQQVTPDDQIFVASSLDEMGGIWTLDDQEPKLLVGTGGFVPGLDADNKFDRIPIGGADVGDATPYPSFSAAGRFAFAARVRNSRTSVHGLWSGDASGVRLLATNEAPLAGVDDATLDGFKYVETNDRGQVVVDTSSTVGSAMYKHLLLRYTPSEGFEKVLMPDDAVTDSDDTSRVVTDFLIPCNGSVFAAQLGRSCQDKDGRIAIVATFADGTTGLLLSNEQARGEPEPPESAPTDASGGSSGAGTGGASAGGSGGKGGTSSTAGGSGGSTNVGGTTSNGGSTSSGGSTSKGGSSSTTDAGAANDGKAPAPVESSKESGGCSLSTHREQGRGTATLLMALALGLVSRRRNVVVPRRVAPQPR